MNDFKAKLEKIREELVDPIEGLGIRVSFRDGFNAAVDETLKALRDSGGEFDEDSVDNAQPVIAALKLRVAELEQANDHYKVHKLLSRDVEKLKAENAQLKEHKIHYDRLFAKSVVVPTDEYIENVELRAAGKELVEVMYKISDIDANWSGGIEDRLFCAEKAATAALATHGQIFIDESGDAEGDAG